MAGQSSINYYYFSHLPCTTFRTVRVISIYVYDAFLEAETYRNNVNGNSVSLQLQLLVNGVKS